MSIFHKQKNYAFPTKNNRFQPMRLRYARRKQLTISPEKLKYSSIELDSSFSHKKDKKIYKRLNDSLKILLSEYSLESVQLSDSKADWNMDLILCNKYRYNSFYSRDKDLYSKVSVVKSTILLKSTTGFKNDIGEYILFKIGIPYHSLCGIICKREKRIELFDSSGDEFSTVSSRHRYPQRIVDFMVYGSYTYKKYIDILSTYLTKHFPGFYIERVCNTNLQKEKDDYFCHTWMYYYFYKRMIEQYEPWEIMNYLKRKITSKERVNEIRNFQNFLLYLKE